MSRAQDAYEQLETAGMVLGMAALFCSRPETFPVFREHWLHRAVDGSPTPERKANSRDTVEAMTPEALLAAVAVLRTFLQGYGDRLRSIPDDVLQAMEREMLP